MLVGVEAWPCCPIRPETTLAQFPGARKNNSGSECEGPLVAVSLRLTKLKQKRKKASYICCSPTLPLQTSSPVIAPDPLSLSSATLLNCRLGREPLYRSLSTHSAFPRPMGAEDARGRRKCGNCGGPSPPLPVLSLDEGPLPSGRSVGRLAADAWIAGRDVKRGTGQHSGNARWLLLLHAGAPQLRLIRTADVARAGPAI